MPAAWFSHDAKIHIRKRNRGIGSSSLIQPVEQSADSKAQTMFSSKPSQLSQRSPDLTGHLSVLILTTQFGATAHQASKLIRKSDHSCSHGLVISFRPWLFECLFDRHDGTTEASRLAIAMATQFPRFSFIQQTSSSVAPRLLNLRRSTKGANNLLDSLYLAIIYLFLSRPQIEFQYYPSIISP